MMMLKQCSVCGQESTQFDYVGCGTDMNDPELDGRHGTIRFPRIQKCPNCGYLSTDIARHTNISLEFIKSDAYINCDPFGTVISNIRTESIDESIPGLEYLRLAAISLEINAPLSAYYNYIFASWVADNYENDSRATKYRLLALEQIPKITDTNLETLSNEHPNNGRYLNQREQFELTYIDLLRRTRQFNKVIDLCEKNDQHQSLLKDSILFEVKLSKANDDRKHFMEEVELQDYDYQLNEKKNAAKIKYYSGQKTHLKMPQRIKKCNVIEISDNAFNNSQVINLVLPYGLEKIGNQAFFNCTKLMSINIPSSVKRVGKDAFRNCNKLLHVHVSVDNFKIIEKELTETPWYRRMLKSSAVLSQHDEDN